MRITLAKLSKTYPGRVRAVRDVSLEIADGELLVILGPSGCGKTTLLRMIAGLERPSAGHVLFNDKRVTRVKPAQRRVGFVFQQPVLYPHMTVRENLAFVLRRKQITDAERQQHVEAIAKQFRVEKLLERKPSEVSVGEQQRVCLGRAVLREPTCLLLDEPMASLDTPLRNDLRREIKAMHAQQRVTTILVTHDQHEAFALADRVAIMAHGRLHQFGTPHAVYRTPASAFVARFLGSPGMNLIEGKVFTEDGRSIFAAGEFVRVSLPQLTESPAAADVTLGIRPEDITIEPAGVPSGESAGAIDATVTEIEQLGDRSIVHARTDDGIVLVIKPIVVRSLHPGQRIGARFRHDATHLFERSGLGKRIG